MNAHRSPAQLVRLLVCVVAVCASPCYAQSGKAWLNLLRQGNFARLEAETAALQKRFADGAETEFAMREAYRPFYDLTAQDLQKMDEWQKAYPRSYAVRLIRGTYYKRAGFAARGEQFASETPEENFTEMRRLHALAIPELQESLSLTEKPYLSVWHLIDLREGDHLVQKALMDSGTKMLPSNRLVRARYMRALTPRWGGSYEMMTEFLEYARSTGATKPGLMELEAIIYEDIGDIAMRNGDQERAVKYFRKALELGVKVGGETPQELSSSWYYRCHLPGLEAYCR